jgi:hypothetical protein
MNNIKSTISFRKDFREMVVTFLNYSLDKKNITKYIKKHELVYLTKTHLIMFTHHLLKLQGIRVPFLKDVTKRHTDTNKESNDLMESLITTEEIKYDQLIDQIEKHINKPRIKFTHNQGVTDATLILRNE